MTGPRVFSLTSRQALFGSPRQKSPCLWAPSAHIIKASDRTPPPSPDRAKRSGRHHGEALERCRRPGHLGNGETAPAIAFAIKVPMAISQII